MPLATSLCFGMIYGDYLKGLNITGTETVGLINLNLAFGMIVGLISGQLISMYGYRKVAIAGSILSSTGFILCSFSSTFIHFIITYGIINDEYIFLNST